MDLIHTHMYVCIKARYDIFLYVRTYVCMYEKNKIDSLK